MSWTEAQVLDLQAELTRTRAELETLRQTTAELITAILAELHDSSRRPPVSGVAAEIQGLAELSEMSDEEVYGEGIGGEMVSIDLTNQESLCRLDRRFRWGPGGRSRI